MRSISKALPRFSVLALALSSLVAGAAEPLTLRQAAEAALAANPAMDVARAQILQSEAGVLQAEGARLPRLALSLNLTRSNDALTAFGLKLGQQRITAADFDPLQLNNPVAINNFNTRAEITAPLYSGGQLSARLNMSQALARAARAGDEATRQALLLDTLKAYAGVQLAQARLRLAEQAHTAAEAAARDSEKLLQQGLTVRSDVLSAKVHVGDSRARLLAGRQQLATAEDRLRLVMLQSGSGPLEIATPFDVSVPEAGSELLVEAARQQHPRLRALRDQRDAAQAGEHGARGARRPQLTFMARQDWNDQNLGFAAASYTLAGVLTWQAFDGGVAAAGIDQARAQRLEADARLRAAEAEVEFTLKAALRQQQATEERLNVRREAVSQAEEAQRLIKVRYANGVTTLVDLLAGQTRLDQARAEQAQAEFERVTARGEVLLAAGALTLERF